jgi:hypothetical protein
VTVVHSDVSSSIAPTIKTSLTGIATSINSTILTIAPALTGSIAPLVPSEAEAVIEALGEIQTILSNVTTTLETLVGSVVTGKVPFGSTFHSS